MPPCPLMNISGGHATKSDSEVDDKLMWFYAIVTIGKERCIVTLSCVSIVPAKDEINIYLS